MPPLEPSGYVLSAEDVRQLRKLLRSNAVRLQNTTGRPPPSNYGGVIEDEEHPGSEIYVACTPSTGLPALTQDVGTSTSTTSCGEGDKPGSATCKIFRLIQGSSGYLLYEVSQLTRVVYNLSANAIGAHEWILVAKDKFGHWYAVTPGGCGLQYRTICDTGYLFRQVSEDCGVTWVDDDYLGVRCDQPGTGTDEGGTGTAPEGDDGPGAGNCYLAVLDSDDCVEFVGPENIVIGRWDGSGWTGDDPLEYCGGSLSGTPRLWFDGGILHLSIGGAELLGCGDGCWTGGPLTGHECPGTDDGPCTGQTFTVCVRCACCPAEGYAGPGWYCISSGTGTSAADCTPVFVLGDGDQCDAELVICSGPYDSEAEAAAVCDPLVSDAICDGVDADISTELYIHFVAGCTGGFAGLVGQTIGPMVWDGAGSWVNRNTQLGFTVFRYDLNPGPPWDVKTGGVTLAGCANDTTGLTSTACPPAWELTNTLVPGTGTCQTGSDTLSYRVDESPI